MLHFAGVPDPARAREDPARAVRENAGTTANLLDGCLEHGAALIYPSTVRAALEPPPDAYGLSKRLGEEACRHHAARSAVARLTSVFGPGQVAWEGATGAIAAFARRALENRPIVIPGDPQRVRDFVYVDDVVAALEAIALQGRWGETLTLASGTPDAAAARRAAGPRRRGLRRADRDAGRRAAAGRGLGLPRGGRPGASRLDRPSHRGRCRLLCRVAPPPSRCSRPLLRPTRSPTACRAATGAAWSSASRPGTSRRPRRWTPRSRSAAAPPTPARVLTAECPVAWPSGAFVRVDRLDDEAKRGIEASARFAAGIGAPVLTIHLFVPMTPEEYRDHGALDEEAVADYLRLLRRRLPRRGRHAADRERAAGAADAHRRRLPDAGRRPLARPRASGAGASTGLRTTFDTSHAALFEHFAAAYPSLFGLAGDGELVARALGRGARRA